MRAMDEETIAAVGIPGAVLMETAGRAVATAVLEMLVPEGKVVVVCGAGNNGGDGFVAARVLQQHGCDCELFLCSDESSINGDAKVFFEAYKRCGGAVQPLRTGAELSRAEHSLAAAAIVVDAIFGTGLCRKVEGHLANVIRAMGAAKAPIVAIDIPSGVSADTGAALGECIEASVTVAMGAAKIGNICAPGFAWNGRLLVAEIGIPTGRLHASANIFLVEASDVARLFPAHGDNTHKGRKGHVLAIAGSPGKRGAGRLAALAALRSGAGLVTLASAAPDSAAPDPVMNVRVGSAEELSAAWQGKAALLLGPGMSADEDGAKLVAHAIAKSPHPMVLDADALNHLAADVSRARSGLAPQILTPHPKEAGRLLGMTTAEVQADRIAASRALAAMTGAVIVLKGARTCIADGRSAGKRVLVCRQGGAELATAGTGDVLAGMAAGLLAQGLDAADAAMLAVYWHGVAGRKALEHVGGCGVIASDVVSAIPASRTQITASD